VTGPAPDLKPWATGADLDAVRDALLQEIRDLSAAVAVHLDAGAGATKDALDRMAVSLEALTRGQSDLVNLVDKVQATLDQANSTPVDPPT
jgi:hypothetical protein